MGACHCCLQLSIRLEPLGCPSVKVSKVQPCEHRPRKIESLHLREKVSSALWVRETAIFALPRVTLTADHLKCQPVIYQRSRQGVRLWWDRHNDMTSDGKYNQEAMIRYQRNPEGTRFHQELCQQEHTMVSTHDLISLQEGQPRHRTLHVGSGTE